MSDDKKLTEEEMKAAAGAGPGFRRREGTTDGVDGSRIDETERKEVLRVLHEPEHVDEAPATVYAKLLDDGVYLASTATMYRILRDAGEVSERRRQATHPARVKPELVAVPTAAAVVLEHAVEEAGGG